MSSNGLVGKILLQEECLCSAPHCKDPLSILQNTVYFSFSCGCSPGSHNHPDYWSASSWGFSQLQTNRIFHPLHAQTTQVFLTLCDKIREESCCMLNWDWISKRSIVVLSSLSSLVKSGDTGNGVTFRSGDNVDLGPSHIGVSFIDTAMQMVSPARMFVSS